MIGLFVIGTTLTSILVTVALLLIVRHFVDTSGGLFEPPLAGLTVLAILMAAVSAMLVAASAIWAWELVSAGSSLIPRPDRRCRGRRGR